MLDYQTLDSFFAEGDFHVGNETIPAKAICRLKHYSTDALNITLWSDHRETGRLFDLSMGVPNLSWFEGRTEFDEHILLKGIRVKTIHGFRLFEGDVGCYLSGNIDITVNINDNIFIKAQISSSPTIDPEWIYTTRFDGTITSHESTPRIGIQWQYKDGIAKLLNNYEYFVDENLDKSALVRITTNSVFIEYKSKNEEGLSQILLDFQKSIYEDLLLLSFIGRKRVICYEADISFKKGNTKHQIFARYRTWQGFYNLPSDQSFLRSLITPNTLRSGIFSQLINSYRNSKYNKIINRTIPYLLTSYEDGYLETHLVNAYAALESMIAGLDEDDSSGFILDKSIFNSLAGKIKKVINTEISDKYIARNIINKIPELRRQGITERLINLLEKFNANTDLIWPSECNKTKELHEIIKRRNKLIHTGVIEDGSISYFDLSRIQKLTELWILKLIGCSDENIFKESLWRDQPINKYLHY
jgi:hypothetical protein